MRNIAKTTFVSAALLLAACGRQSTMDEAMKRDLEAASAGSIELAPNGPSTKIVSALESKNAVQPRVTPVRQTMAPANSPRLEIPQPATTAAAPTDRSAPEPTAARPSSVPRVQSCPGGCKSVNEVIRNAPFPIKPVTKQP
jgi:hypothetical protein